MIADLDTLLSVDRGGQQDRVTGADLGVASRDARIVDPKVDVRAAPEDGDGTGERVLVAVHLQPIDHPRAGLGRTQHVRRDEPGSESGQ